MNEPFESDSPQPSEPAVAEVAAVAQAESVVIVDPSEPTERSRIRLWVMCAVGFLALSAVLILMVVAGGQFREFAVAGLTPFPFAILAVLAYASHPKRTGGMVLTLTYWGLLVGAVGLASFGLTIIGVLHPALGPGSRAEINAPTTEQILRILAAAIALLAAGGIGLLCFTTWIRKRAATWFDMDPQSLVHATALATTVTMTLMCTISLLAANEPAMLWLFNPESGAKLPDSGSNMRSTVYGLIWAVPASFFAVGFPIKRTLREAQQRLALVWPTRLQLVVAIAIALVMVLAVAPFQFLITALWNALGWRMTDTAALEELFKFAMQPMGAIIVGISAGLGEELVFRGVLQPRLGIVLPAAMFTAIHAFQYDFDALLWVMLLGLLMGLVRRKTNTTTCVVIHATYDLVLLLAAPYVDSF